MRYKTQIAAAVLVAFTAGGIATQWNALSGSFSAARGSDQRARANSEGLRRDEVLKSLTRAYVARGNQASSQMIAGAAFAPVDYLNIELGRQGAKWRVRDGGAQERIEIFDIS